MTDQSVTAADEGKVGDEANGPIAGFKSCDSATRAVMADPPQTPTKEAMRRQIAKLEDVMGHPSESENAKLAGAEHGSKL